MMKLLALALTTAAATQKVGEGVGDCTGCTHPVNTVIEAGNITLEDCINWMNQGCPNNVWPGNESQPRNCAKGSNAIGYNIAQGICRVFSCASPPGVDGTDGWKCYYGGGSPDITNDKKNFFYPSLPHTCLQNASTRIPCLDGYYTVNLAADACSEYEPATGNGEHCAGFWYDRSKPTFCPFSTLTCYYFYFHSEFQPVKGSSGKCGAGTALPSASLRGHSHALSRSLELPYPIATQIAFHIYPGKLASDTYTNYTGNYSTGPGHCIDDDSCKSYTWTCSTDLTSVYKCGACPSNNRMCEAKFPTDATLFQYSGSPRSFKIDKDSALFVKTGRCKEWPCPGEESMEIYE
jgi:hypothetical protein